jgi:hypothetical protein
MKKIVVTIIKAITKRVFGTLIRAIETIVYAIGGHTAIDKFTNWLIKVFTALNKA